MPRKRNVEFDIFIFGGGTISLLPAGKTIFFEHLYFAGAPFSLIMKTLGKVLSTFWRHFKPFRRPPLFSGLRGYLFALYHQGYSDKKTWEKVLLTFRRHFKPFRSSPLFSGLRGYFFALYHQGYSDKKTWEKVLLTFWRHFKPFRSSPLFSGLRG